MTIGVNLRQLRKRANLSQEQLADKVFVSKQMISAIEHDAKIPNLALAGRIAVVLNCTVDDLCKSA